MSHPGAARMGELGKEGLQAKVGELCDQLGLYHYHVPDSRRVSRKGFPDSFIMNTRTGAHIWRELKAESGQLTSEQKAFGYAMIAGGGDWAMWKPHDLYDGSINSELRTLADVRVWRAG